MTARRSPRSAIVIINPLSGYGRQQSQIESHAALAQQILAAHGVDNVVRSTTKAGDAHTFAREAVESGCDLVVAWGGDGTINEAASALVFTDVPLAIVPAGSGNGLASDLLIPFEPVAALTLAATGRTMVIDAGQVNDRYFFNIAGVGVDAVIAARFNERGMRRRGPLAYMQLSTAELLRYQCLTYAMTFDDGHVEQQAMLVAFANGRQYGNRLLIAPGARPDDGLLEVVIVDQLPLLDIAWRLPALFRGTLAPGRGVTMRSSRSIHITAECPVAFHVDGEPHLDGRELHVRVIPAALKLVVTAA